MPFLRNLIILATITWGIQLFSQCTPVFTDTPSISDRYVDAVQYRNQLVLANAHGLTIKDLARPEGDPLAVLPVPGEVTEIFMNGNRLFVTAQQAGLYAFTYQEGVEFPVQTAYYPIPNLKSAAVNGHHVFADVEFELVHYIIEDDELKEASRLNINPTKIIANEDLVLVHSSDSTLTAVPYSESGLSIGRKLTVDGNSTFYDIHYNGDLVVLDALNGVKWLKLSDRGVILEQGFFFNNKEDDGVVFGSDISGDRLFIRFEDKLGLYIVNNQRQLTRTDTLNVPFSEIGSTRLIPGETDFHMLNLADYQREWSVEGYHITGGRASLTARVGAQFDELVGAVILSGQIYLATSRSLFIVRDTDDIRDFDSLTLARQFDGPIMDIAGSETYLFVATALAGSGQSRLDVFNVGDSGALLPAYSQLFSGQITGLTEYGGHAAFVQFTRTSQGDNYQPQVIVNDKGVFRSQALGSEVPLAKQNLYKDLQVSELGLTYHNNETIRVYSDITNLSQSFAFEPLSGEPVVNLVSHEGLLWIETASGLSIQEPNNRRADRVGFYPNWHNLDYLANKRVIVQNRMDRIPSHFHLLSLDENGGAFAQLSFSTSTRPVLITAYRDEVFLAEKTALNFFRFNCPDQENFYVLPFSENFELEISSLIDETDIVTMKIYNEANEVIGTQKLNRDTIDAHNGKLIGEWLIDFNSLETPAAISLNSSKTLAPVISGGGDEVSGRFAYRAPALSGGAYYVPHVPRNLSVWSTDLYIRTVDEEDTAVFAMRDAAGDVVTRETPAGHTELVPIVENTFNTSGTPWVALSGELGTYLSGFSVMRTTGSNQAAAVPFIQELSDFLIIPYLAGAHREGDWTGMVLANPHDQTIPVRLVGYNDQGEILVDRTEDIEPSSSMVTLAETWLKDFVRGDQVRWMAAFPQKPIMGMLLYGNQDAFAGLPMTSRCGEQLLFSGIRSNSEWWSSVVITNMEAEETPVTIEAYDGFGNMVQTAEFTLSPKQTLRSDVQELFPGLTLKNRAGVQTLRVKNDHNLSGFIFRGKRNKATLEAVSALVLE